MTLTRKTMLGLGAALIAATTAFAGGHSASPEEKAVKARQAHMQLYSFNLGILGGMAKGEMDFNADLAQAVAGDLATLATMSQAAYWLPGTTTDDMEGTNALPAGWEMMEDTMAKAMALGEAANAMAAAAGTLEGVQGAIGAVGGACGACHKATRKPQS